MNSPPNLAGRFTGRSENYSRYRPGYPDAVVRLLQAEAGWTCDSNVADIGAGTGISAELFLRHGNRVWAVEPNADMRAAAASLSERFPRLEIVDGSAEATGLPAACADFAVAATAFHWFDVDGSRAEFLRILKPEGRAVLMWNKRDAAKSPFLQGYEELLQRFGTDYEVRWGRERHNLPEKLARFFGPEGCRNAVFDNPQPLDLDGLVGRLLSASYAPMPGHPAHEPMVAAIGALFEKHQQDGLVVIEYDLSVYWGRPAAA